MNANYFTPLRRASSGLCGVFAMTMAVLTAGAQPAQPTAPAQDAGRAQRGGGGGNNNVQRGGNPGNFSGGLNFDEKQRELLQEARQVHADELRKLNEKLAEAQKEFVKAVVAEKYVEKVVREKAEAIGKIQAEILALHGQSFATVSPTLKPEQREVLEGNARLGILIISPAGGPFTAPPGGGRGNFGGGPGGLGGPEAGGGADRTLRRGADRGTPGAPGAPDGGGNTRRRGENPGQ